MLILLIIENIILFALGYFLVTTYGINKWQVKAFIAIILDRVKDAYYDYKFDVVRRLITTYKAYIRRFKR